MVNNMIAIKSDYTQLPLSSDQLAQRRVEASRIKQEAVRKRDRFKIVTRLMMATSLVLLMILWATGVITAGTAGFGVALVALVALFSLVALV